MRHAERPSTILVSTLLSRNNERKPVHPLTTRARYTCDAVSSRWQEGVPVHRSTHGLAWVKPWCVGTILTQIQQLDYRKSLIVCPDSLEFQCRRSRVQLADRTPTKSRLVVCLRTNQHFWFEPVSNALSIIPNMNSLPPGWPPLFPKSWLVESSYKNSRPSNAKP